MDSSNNFYNLLISLVTCEASLPGSIMDCLQMLFPNCVQSWIFSGKDDDSFWGGEKEQRSSRDSDQETPSTTISRMRSEVMVYEPGTSDLAYDLNNPVKPRVETDSCRCQVEKTSGKLVTELSIFGPVFSLWGLQNHGRYKTHLGDGLHNQVIAWIVISLCFPPYLQILYII